MDYLVDLIGDNYTVSIILLCCCIFVGMFALGYLTINLESVNYKIAIIYMIILIAAGIFGIFFGIVSNSIWDSKMAYCEQRIQALSQNYEQFYQTYEQKVEEGYKIYLDGTLVDAKTINIDNYENITFDNENKYIIISILDRER